MVTRLDVAGSSQEETEEERGKRLRWRSRWVGGVVVAGSGKTVGAV
jgi:hypothetical protein